MGFLGILYLSRRESNQPISLEVSGAVVSFVWPDQPDGGDHVDCLGKWKPRVTPRVRFGIKRPRSNRGVCDGGNKRGHPRRRISNTTQLE